MENLLRTVNERICTKRRRHMQYISLRMTTVALFLLFPNSIRYFVVYIKFYFGFMTNIENLSYIFRNLLVSNLIVVFPKDIQN